MKKTVGIFTTFGSWDEAYSPCNVVKHQLHMLVRYGYKPILFVLDCFPANFKVEGVEIRRTIPTTVFEPYQGLARHRQVPKQFETDVAKIVPALESEFKSIDILLCHDVIFQDSFFAYNAALHRMIMPVGIKMYHWMHSGPSERPRNVSEPISYLYTLPTRSKLIYMNRYDVIRAAEMYGTTQENVRVVHNPVDYRLQGVEFLTDHIISDYKLNEADVIAVYPLSTTRMGAGGKQLNKAIKVMGAIKKTGSSVRLIVPNAHANAEKEKMAISEMLMLAKSHGLSENEVVFTSMIKKEFQNGIPHNVVLELLRYSDVFLFPSVSENCPLVLLEAALGKNLMVLNEDFSPMKDFVGPYALYFKFDSIMTVTHHDRFPDGEDGYYREVGKVISAELLNNKIYQANKMIRKNFNINFIFEQELEPLFFEHWVGDKERVMEQSVPEKPTQPVYATEGDQDLLEPAPAGFPDMILDRILETEEQHG